ncbi:hypothetical protein F3J38_20635 [Pantoea sp. Acro-805]|jgi:hypothetical protein|uniref:Uncharacterized protein n=1 Tax=Candidatus Pantoea formicae TaxID=2608355 RepID=A0ABX0QZN6_9GAMM|nr:hypothetical protein [Pantoea formicae]MDF7649922.1 hypothetical protein [Erwiniaceae bacterium L1_54_3]NIF02433.1 hypothetical protein [Pantoea formicae]
MPEYCFFKKGDHVNVLEKNDASGAACLREWGYAKQSEELNAPNTHCALARFHHIHNEERSSKYAFSSEAAFLALIVGLIAVMDWLFL